MDAEDYDNKANRRLIAFMKSSFSDCWDEFHAFSVALITTSPAERIPIAFEFFKSRNVFPTIEHKSMKSSAKALRLKNLGNDKFSRGAYVEALKLYTQSAASAPAGSPELAIAFSNRSAALLKLERFEACIVDINRALSENFPETSKQKLYDRKKKCCSILTSRHAFKSGKSYQKLSIQEKILRRAAGDNAKKFEVDKDAMDMNYAGRFPIPETILKNESISNASDKIKIDFNSTFGRHVVAVKDIEIGEVIGIEKPYASFLKLEYRYSHCANCFVRCEALIPCPTCSEVMYCSRRCKDDAFARSHKIECKLLSFLQHFPLPSSVWWAIRALMVITKQGDDLHNIMKHPLLKTPMKAAFEGVPETVDSQDPVHLLNMKDNLEFINSWEVANMKLFDEDTLNVKLIREAAQVYRVMFVVEMLRNTPFFGPVQKTQGKNKKRLKKEKYVGLLFLKLTSCIPKYGSAINEFHQEDDALADLNFPSNTFIGHGLYMFHSFFNHSCFENVARCYHKDALVTRATQPIKAGEQLFMNYGTSFMINELYERAAYLFKHSEFECSCDACKYDWPLFENMSNHLEFLPNANISLKKLDGYTLQLHEKFSALGVTEFCPELFNFFKEYLKIFHDNFKIPSQDYLYGYQAFQILLQSEGNNYVYSRDKAVMLL